MIPIQNYISKLFFQDTSSSYTVITYMDIAFHTKEEILQYMTEVLHKNEMLHNRVIMRDEELYFEKQNKINLEDQYEINYLEKESFSSIGDALINADFPTDLQWRFVWCIDNESKAMRLYFKIHHGYADGYQIIRILTSPYKDEEIEKQFKRKTTIFQTIYYFIFGFISLISIYCKFLYRTFFLNKESLNKIDSEIITFEEIKLDKVKEVTKEKKITVNDFLYSVMLLTDKYYRKEKRELHISSPINISLNKDTNNITPIFNVIQVSESKKNLLDNVHTTFDSLKYSFFIPFITFFIRNITYLLPIDTLGHLYDKIVANSDYIFSNIIGPELKHFPKPVQNIGFFTTPKNKEIIFNIISYQNNITINITCKKNVIQDKERYLQCLHDAYIALLEA